MNMLTGWRCKLIYTAFDEVDQFSTDCVQKYEQALLSARREGIKIRALLLCNPHNPLGKCYPFETLKELFMFCHRYSIHLISDEIYALSVFNVEGSKRTPFTSVLSIDPTGLLRTDQIHVQYGMSKVRPIHWEEIKAHSLRISVQLAWDWDAWSLKIRRWPRLPEQLGKAIL
jgi:xeroderma pigmentosum group C-complementing protein